jgi:FkbM family methyltransferase
MDRRSFLLGTLAGAAGAGVVGSAGVAGAVEWDIGSLPRPAGPPGPASKARQSFAQQGEDIVLYHLLHDWMKLESPTYLDIGAADPIQSNNTFLLYWTGGRGVLVEPNPTYVAEIRKQRPGDVVVQAGVGIGEAVEADYYVIRGAPTLNTFSPEQVAMYRKGSPKDPVEKVVKMPLVSVNRLIAECLGQAPDLLSIDVEGLDLDILRSLDFATYRPGAIIAETILMNGGGRDNTGIAGLLISKGYVVRGGSLYNTIFADPRRYS